MNDDPKNVRDALLTAGYTPEQVNRMLAAADHHGAMIKFRRAVDPLAEDPAEEEARGSRRIVKALAERLMESGAVSRTLIRDGERVWVEYELQLAGFKR